MTPLADVARSLFRAAIGAVQPAALIRQLRFTERGLAFREESVEPGGRLVLLALGKAAPGLATAFLTRSVRPPDAVFVLAPHDVPAPEALTPHLHRGRHPFPDAEGERSCARLLELLSSLSPADAVVLLLSGGASALLARPLPGLEREEIVALTRALMQAGAGIGELNTVRKHLLAAAGGRLAAACPAPLLTLALSDVVGDDLATIASGPTVADPTTFADALGVLERRGLATGFPRVATFLLDGAAGRVPESPKPGDDAVRRSRAHLLGTSREALEAASRAAREQGFAAAVLTRSLRGEARAVGAALAQLARAMGGGEPVALLAAGETTVTVRGRGRGGRNLELALGAAAALAGAPERCVLAGGTDGVDGSSPAAGAVVDGNTLRRAAARGRDADLALGENDSWGFFCGLPEAIITGPTGTNVADLVLVLAQGRPRDYLAPAELCDQIVPVVPA